jgi:hypothetical protein
LLRRWDRPRLPMPSAGGGRPKRGFGIVGNLFLVLFFLVAKPWQLGSVGGGYGTINDLLIALQLVLLIPIVIWLSRRRPKMAAAVDGRRGRSAVLLRAAVMAQRARAVAAALAVLVAAWGLTHIVLSIRMACPAGRLKVGLHRQRG